MELTTKKAYELSQNHTLVGEYGEIKKIKPYQDGFYLVYYELKVMPEILCMDTVKNYIVTEIKK